MRRIWRAMSNACAGGASRWSTAWRSQSSRRLNHGWLSFEQGALDHLQVPVEYGTLVAPNGRLAPSLARRGVRLDVTPMADVTVSYFNMEHPLVGGYTAEKVALRRAISLGFNANDFIKSGL